MSFQKFLETTRQFLGLTQKKEEPILGADAWVTIPKQGETNAL